MCVLLDIFSLFLLTPVSSLGLRRSVVHLVTENVVRFPRPTTLLVCFLLLLDGVKNCLQHDSFDERALSFCFDTSKMLNSRRSTTQQPSAVFRDRSGHWLLHYCWILKSHGLAADWYFACRHFNSTLVFAALLISSRRVFCSAEYFPRWWLCYLRDTDGWAIYRWCLYCPLSFIWVKSTKL